MIVAMSFHLITLRAKSTAGKERVRFCIVTTVTANFSKHYIHCIYCTVLATLYPFCSPSVSFEAVWFFFGGEGKNLEFLTFNRVDTFLSCPASFNSLRFHPHPPPPHYNNFSEILNFGSNRPPTIHLQSRLYSGYKVSQSTPFARPALLSG